ncbi:unnamed protein product [Paramecium sonneborni]|uniref:Uncharacterized protein n=1 Tax=Paramecium sonneborni TaxID=65129 RepID=A0A8S1QCC0_9CILI|nr:unnamed protein product [Paramecium sonneborni]
MEHNKQNMISFLGILKTIEINDEKFDQLESHINKQNYIQNPLIDSKHRKSLQCLIQYLLIAFQGLIKIQVVNPQALLLQVKEANMIIQIFVQYLNEIIGCKFWNESGQQLLKLFFGRQKLSQSIQKYK